MEIIYKIVILTSLLLLLYVFRILIIRYFSLISILSFGSNKIGVYFYHIFFLPGVIIHELSHFLMAGVLGVPTGNLQIFPQKSEKSLPAGRQGWTLGQVSSAKTDILRSNLIGLAPLLVGIIGQWALISVGLEIKTLNDLKLLTFNWQALVQLYMVLTLANTMFISESDRDSIWALPTVFAVLLLFLKFLGANMVLSGVGDILSRLADPLIFSFSLTAVIDAVFILPLALLINLLVKIRKR